jgi:hypothetical protein
MFKRKPKADVLREKLQVESDIAAVLNETLGAYASEWYGTRQRNNVQRLVTEQGEWVSEFKANNKTYYIRNPREGLPLRRQRELEKMSVVVPFNAGLGEIISSLSRMKVLCNSLVGKDGNFTGLIEEIVNLERGLTTSNRKWQASLVMCTLFIYEPGEDLRTWDIEQANRKIEDWATEGLIEEDFFTLAMQWSTYKIQLQARLLEKVKAAARLFGYTDL